MLFDRLNLHISRGEKLALVARNGTGKTTLLRVLAGEEAPEGESSRILLARGIKVGYLRQDPNFDLSHTALEAVLDVDNELVRATRDYEQSLLHPDDGDAMQKALERMDDLKAWDVEARVKEILSRLNVGQLDQRVSELSGGQLKRLALARILIEEPDFLILDEPTNHLDLDMIEWLEKYLQRATLTLFMVTHDRYFLERVCDHIVELDGHQLYRYRGSYSDYLEKKAAREANEAVVLEKDKQLFKRELEWMRRMPQGRGTKAKARIDTFYEIKERASKRRAEDKVQLEIKAARLGSKILEAHHVNKSYGDTKLIDDFFYKFKKRERVGIVGPNGVGKTTFLKILTKAIRPDSGKVIIGDTVVFGYYTQSGLELKEDKRVIDVVRDIAEYIPLEKGQKISASQMLERFLFEPKHQQVYASQLSGGERRRLHLLTILMANPNFLILDEPTNDLDIITLNVLEEFLLDFPGCLMIVSHDRYFMDKIVDHLFIFEGDGKIRDYNGNYTVYREMTKERELMERRQDRDLRKKEEKAAAALQAKAPVQGMSYEQRKEFKRLEKTIEKLEEQKQTLIGRFNDTGLSPQDIEKLSIELGELNQALEEKEMRWMELAELSE